MTCMSLTQPFYVALRLCDEMAEVRALPAAHDMARAHHVVFVQGAALD